MPFWIRATLPRTISFEEANPLSPQVRPVLCKMVAREGDVLQVQEGLCPPCCTKGN